jgi:hypothetical protein
VISDPTGGVEDQFLGTSVSGSDVFLSTPSRLVASDTDNLADVYDARVGGGFPVSPTPTTCENVCRQPGAGSSAGPPMLSGLAGASGNLPATSSKPLTRAQLLARALKRCRTKRNRHKRASCEASARRHYGKRKAAAKKSNNDRRAK